MESSGTFGMVYLEARSWDCSLAPRPEKYARSVIPGYNSPVESKHPSKTETIRSKGGSRSEPQWNHRILFARCMAESMASGSVMFRRTQRTQLASSMFCFPRVSGFRTDTRSPPRSAHGPFCTSPVEIRSNARLHSRIPWTRLCFAFPRVRSMRRSRKMAWWRHFGTYD